MDIITPFIRGYQFVLQGNPIALIFTLLSAVQLWRGVQQVGVVRSRWAQWIAAPLAGWKKAAARDMAFYVAIPISIFIHELGHAIAVWFFGGRVIAFGYFFFWGFVQPDRTFSPSQEWIVSVAGTWGNLLFALVVWVALGRNRSKTVRYFAKQTVASQIVYSLIYYPIFTGLFGFGDWRTIYAFEFTPLLSGAWAVFHASVLLAYWLLRQRGWFDALSFADEASAEKFAQFENDDSVEGRSERVRLLMAGGSLREGRRLAVETATLYPNSAEAQYIAAGALSGNRQDVSREAARYAERALQLGLGTAGQQAEAHHILANFEKRGGRPDVALQSMETAVRLGEGQQPPVPNMPAYLYDYALLLRQARREDEGRAVLERAIRAAEQMGQRESAEFFKQERALFE